ncbi:MAG: lactonase family protein [Acidobacteriota bacterium]|nr:lactonase family protein [Acidobacteriota bacterium]
MRFFHTIPMALLLGSVAQLAMAQIMYVGTYTEGTSKGIYAYRYNAKTGRLTPLGLMAPTPDPTFLALHPSGKYLYAVNELNSFRGQRAGAVTAYSVDKATGKLTELNQVSTKSPGPCHLIVDATGKTLMVANYAGGSFASFPIAADGRLGEATSFIQEKGTGPNKQRQEQAHGHSVNLPKSNKFMLGADLGTDNIWVFDLDAANGKITPRGSASVKPGSGPRHLVIAPDQKHVYVMSEMASSVTTFEYDPATAAMKEIDMVSALPANFKGESTGAEIQIDPAGKYVYSSNRGDDSISVFKVDPQTAKLTLIQNQSTGGKQPRAFVLDPAGNFLICGNQATNTITTFRIDHATGKLTPTGEKYDLGAPVTFVFLK